MERLKKIGQVRPKSSGEVRTSRLGIGFEKLDRAVFDPRKAFDAVGALGVKPIRLQSGWARTEKEKGVYDFAWLDDIIDNLCARGLEPWICLCYGNGLYDEKAAKIFGAVGCPPIFTEEQKTAWYNYVKTTVSRYSDRVRMWEVWNEPDGDWCWKHGANGREYGQFVADTAKAIREGDPHAYVIGGSVCIRDIAFLAEALEAGMADCINGLTFHEYTAREEFVLERVSVLSALAHSYHPEIEIIQGESGSQSRSDGMGALRGGSWTPRKQAKQLLRHQVIDLLADVKFSSFFTTVDMIEALNGSVDNKASYLDFGYFGVLSADFDEDGIACGSYTPKPSYYALQNLASLLADSVVTSPMAVLQTPGYSGRSLGSDESGRALITGGFLRQDNGAQAFVFWKPADLMTTEFEGTASFEIGGKKTDLSKIALVDPMDGAVWSIPDSMLEVKANGAVVQINHLPIRDYPMFLTFGDFADLL